MTIDGARRSRLRLVGPRVLAPALVLAVGGWLALAPGVSRAATAPARSAAAPARSAAVPLVLPLRANLAGLERFARAVSTPGSPQYGRFEPVAVLASRFGASPANRARVTAYLTRAGARNVRIDVTGLFADATMRPALARRLFSAPPAWVPEALAARLRLGTAARGGVHIPDALHSAVTGVVGLDGRPLFGGAATGGGVHRVSRYDGSGYQARTGTATGCAAATSQTGFTPNQYLTAYGYNQLQSAGVQGQGERVALIEIDGFRYSDLRHFADCFGFSTPAINGYGVGLSHPLKPGAESTLDLEVLDASAPALKEIDVYESRPSAVDVLHSLTAPLGSRARQPDVISASLGSCESATLVTIGRAGLRTVEGALALAAATGISVFASSGDTGSSACLTPSDRPLPGLAVSYPASSPWVTGVGGTNVTLNAANQITAQQVWNDAPLVTAAGGGGASTLFKRPWYQDGVVKAAHREVPDVSMLADVLPGYEVYCTAPGACAGRVHGEHWTQVGGTSAAAPLLAGGIALVDQELRMHGRQNVGLANPLLYRIGRSSFAPSVISDVTANGNDLGASISGSPFGCCTAGPGYDEASGLGSVNIAALALIAAGAVPKIAAVGLTLPTQRHPVASRRLLARVSCSRGCLMGADARIRIGRSRRAISVASPMRLLRRAGRYKLAIELDRRVLTTLRRALAGRRAVVATVYGVVYDAGGQIEARTRARRLTIRH
ncbi:MAG: S53 family peptidase [Solirubrobacteraceae bacterium]